MAKTPWAKYCNTINYCIYWGQWIRKTVYDVSFRSTWFDLAGNNFHVIVRHCHIHLIWNMGIKVLIGSYHMNLTEINLFQILLHFKKQLTPLQLLQFSVTALRWVKTVLFCPSFDRHFFSVRAADLFLYCQHVLTL